MSQDVFSRRLILRPTSRADLPDLRRIVFEPRVYSKLMVDPREYFRDLEVCADGLGWTEDIQKSSVSATLVADSQAVAGALLEPNGLSYFVEPRLWRLGIGSRFVSMFLGEMWRRPGMTEIRASVLRGNIASQSILERVGFRFAGLAYRTNGMMRHAVLNYRCSLR